MSAISIFFEPQGLDLPSNQNEPASPHFGSACHVGGWPLIFEHSSAKFQEQHEVSSINIAIKACEGFDGAGSTVDGPMMLPFSASAITAGPSFRILRASMVV